MRKLVIALACGLGLLVPGVLPVGADSGTTARWTVFDYNSSGRALAPRVSAESMPATTSDGVTWRFNFRSGVYTALFTTSDPGLTGNLCPAFPAGCPTLTDVITLSGNPLTSFVTQDGGGDCVGNTPAAVRFYLTAPAASGPSIGTPPRGFYTRFWWSNPVNMQLLTGTGSGRIVASLGDPNEWSDWDGIRATAVPEAFAEATQNVQSIGLSFGGECFFETGVTPNPATDGETFSSTFSESS